VQCGFRLVGCRAACHPKARSLLGAHPPLTCSLPQRAQPSVSSVAPRPPLAKRNRASCSHIRRLKPCAIQAKRAIKSPAATQPDVILTARTAIAMRTCPHIQHRRSIHQEPRKVSWTEQGLKSAGHHPLFHIAWQVTPPASDISVIASDSRTALSLFLRLRCAPFERGASTLRSE
jgi:hypothetical protein